MESRDEVAQVDVDDFGCPTSCSTCWRASFDGCRWPENDEETNSGDTLSRSTVRNITQKVLTKDILRYNSWNVRHFTYRSFIKRFFLNSSINSTIHKHTVIYFTNTYIEQVNLPTLF